MCRLRHSSVWWTWPSTSAAKDARGSQSARSLSSAIHAGFCKAATPRASIPSKATAARADADRSARPRGDQGNRSDGRAFIIAPDGTVEAAARYIDAPANDITLSKGLGSRHWAAAAITKKTKSVAIAVSESSGTVRLFQNGEQILRIEPFRRPMKWKDLNTSHRVRGGINFQYI